MTSLRKIDFLLCGFFSLSASPFVLLKVSFTFVSIVRVQNYVCLRFLRACNGEVADFALADALLVGHYAVYGYGLRSTVNDSL